MSSPNQNISLSLPARLFCYLGPPSAILLTSLASPRTALLSPLAFLPTAYFFRTWRLSNKANPSRRAELEPLIWTYAAAGTVGLVAVMLVQMAICSAASTILFIGSDGKMKDEFWTEFARSSIDGLSTDELAHRADLATAWQNWVFIGVFSFFGASLVEESLKYLSIVYARRRAAAEGRKRRGRAYVDYAVAGALGFGVVEAVGFIYAAVEQGGETWPRLMFTVFERVVGSIGHLSVAALIALRAIRRDYYGDQMSWWAVVGPSVALHGTHDFVALGASALEGNVGWIHPVGWGDTVGMLGLIGGLMVTAAWLVRGEWKTLEERDRRRE